MALTYGILDGEYSARQFSDMLVPIQGDMVVDTGNKFSLNIRSGLSVRVSSGYAYVSGHWFKMDEPEIITLKNSETDRNRYDAIGIAVDEAERIAELKVITDINPNALMVEDVYYSPLYIISVKMGVSTLYSEDIEDKRVFVGSLHKLSSEALGAYDYINSGIDDTVSDLIDTIDSAVSTAEIAISRIDARAEEKRSTSLGTIVYAMTSPITADKWLLCNGAPIPADYPDLIALIGSNTPIINFSDVRFHAYIYAGAPV